MKPRIGKFTETESRVVVTGSEGTREGELCLMGSETELNDIMNFFVFLFVF